MGRPKKNIDWDVLDQLCELRLTAKDCAAILKIDQETMQSRIYECYKITFSEYRETKLARTRRSLIEKALLMANGGCKTMLIFCLKNLCGWKDMIKQDNTYEIKPMVINRLDGGKVELGFKNKQDRDDIIIDKNKNVNENEKKEV